MKILPQRVLRTLERLNAAYPWDHNAHFHRWILRQLPRQFDHALDVGAGSGDLARALARRANKVTGIDSDPQIIAQAEQQTPATAPIVFMAADVMAEIPAGPYEVVTCVATIHHLPFAEALTTFRNVLSPGGTLVIVGLSQTRTPLDYLLGLVSLPLNPAMGWLKNKGRRSPVPVSMTARTRPAEMTFHELAREARAVLPGVHLRRSLFWRYTLVWHKN